MAILLSIPIATPFARAQNDLRPGSTDKEAAASPELSEVQGKTEELRNRLREWQAKSQEYQRDGQEAKPRMAGLDAEIEQLQNRKAIEIPPGETAAELEARLLEAEQDLAAARREATELDNQAELRVERRKKIPELLSLAKQRLAELEATQPPTSGDAAVAEALAEQYAVRRAVLQAEISAYQSELGSYEARGALIAKRRDRATLRIAYFKALSQRLREAKQELTRLEVQREKQAAEQLLDELTALPDGFDETLVELYHRNEALASIWTSEGGLQDQIKDVSEKLSRAEARVASIEGELMRLAARVEAVGLAESVGVLLRRHRAEAPDVGMYRRFIRMRQEQIGGVQLQQIKLREQREALADIDALVDEVIASVDEPINADERREIEQLLRQLFQTQRRYMDALIEDYETYFQKLVDFDASQQELIDRTEALLDFIDERILWIPTGRAVQADLRADGGRAMAWLVGANYRAQLGRGIVDASKRLWALNVLALLAALLFIPISRRLRSRIERLGELAQQSDCIRFAPTAESLGLTLLLALWLPALLAYVGWRLGVSPVATQYTRCIAHGLVVAAGFWASLRVARQLVRPSGVAQAHCGWPPRSAHLLWRDLGWLAAITVPAVFLIFVFEMRGEDLWRESIGKLVFVIGMAAVLAFNFLALRPEGAIANSLRRRGGRHLWAWRVLRVASLLVPIGLSIAAFRGFYWTSLQFSVRLHFTVVFLFLLLVSVQLAARWSLIAKRRAALEDEARDDKGVQSAPTMEISRLLIGAGLLVAILGAFSIWADLLPATRILQQVELWTTTQTVTVMHLDPSGAQTFSTEEKLVAITLADLLRSLLIGALTLALIRALPGLLEATLFRRLGHGERYAYSTIVKYAVALAGLALAFDAIGVGWSSIQWLVAAIGLGLGFGLQEIFANFISGLIILFERPIRVGDTVSVGNVSGTVSKIRIRATWITAFDRKELIVPNKEFVTGQLINWTLSDPVLRVTVEVGIAYGSDTERAVEVLKQVARDSRFVLEDPPPQVFFLGFGDSSLSFELRAFVRTVERLFSARHDLHMRIDKAFREAGIEIAFPQRDLHLRTVPADWQPPAGRAE